VYVILWPGKIDSLGDEIDSGGSRLQACLSEIESVKVNHHKFRCCFLVFIRSEFEKLAYLSWFYFLFFIIVGVASNESK